MKESTNVNGIFFLLHRKLSNTSGVSSDVAGVRVGLDSLLSFHGIRVNGQSRFRNLRQSVARFVFELGVLSQRHTNSITKTIGQQSTNSNSGFHATIFSFTGFGNSQVKRIVPAQTVLFGSQQPIRLDHNKRVASLHRKDEVVEILASANIREFDCRFYHTTGSVSVKRKNARRKGPVVGSNSHAAVQLLALFDQWVHSFDQILSFLSIVIFRFVYFFCEILSSICKVSRVDTDFFQGFGDHQGYFGLEVHIGTKRNIVSLFEEPLSNRQGCVRFSSSLHCDTDQVKALISATHHFLDGGVDVGCVGRGHRLTNNRVV
mmetsp:Transcript_1500/g.2118  ORF Transcript_1500/g.2118 Transcript_1500/m.2118 type:complete len:318 (-) Transcript_1500:318-1271(-)